VICPFLNYVLWQQTHDKFGNPLPDNIKDMEHEAVVTSVKENPGAPNNPDTGVAIITHGGEKNPDFVPEEAHKYVKGPDKKSKIHVGPSFIVPFSKLRPSQHDWSANIKKLINRIKGGADKPGAEESTSGQQLEHGDEAAGKPAKPTPPNSGAQRGRSPTPPKQGGKGGGGKRKKGGSGGKGGGGKRKKGGSGGKA
jgi:hypothetical protein